MNEDRVIYKISADIHLDIDSDNAPPVGEGAVGTIAAVHRIVDDLNQLYLDVGQGYSDGLNLHGQARASVSYVDAYRAGLKARADLRAAFGHPQ